MIWTKLNLHVNEMLPTAGDKFHNLLWSRFLIIMQNVNMVSNGKHNSRLNPVCAPLRSAAKRRKKEFDTARLATQVTLKDQKGRWDCLKTVLKLKLVKDSEVAEVLLDMLVNFLLLAIIRPCRFGIASIPGAPGNVPICYGYTIYIYRMWCLHTIQV